MIWSNPPFNNAIKTKVEKIPINLLEKGFPKGHTLKRTFIRLGRTTVLLTTMLHIEGAPAQIGIN